MFMNKLLFCFVLKQDLKLKTYPKMTECPIPLLPLPEAGITAVSLQSWAVLSYG